MMSAGGLINANPVVHERKERPARRDADDSAVEFIDSLEVFDHVRDIKDPEHPYSLEQLNVISEDSISVDDKQSHVMVVFTPTVQHCSMATVIGLCLRVQLLRCLPPRFKYTAGSLAAPSCLSSTAAVDIQVAPGSHASEDAVNKQLNDKERIAAALENPNLSELVEECLAPASY